MGMILRIASSRIVGQGDIVGRSGYFSLNLSANSVMRGRLDARRTLKSLVADLRWITKLLTPGELLIISTLFPVWLLEWKILFRMPVRTNCGYIPPCLNWNRPDISK